ncbi:MAG TPA: hypothetical protein VF181_04675 [Balneolaceae bacterium]
MSKELDELLEDFDELSAKAKKDADEEVAGRISSVTTMTKDEITSLFPKRGDQKKLAELMQIVKSAENRNSKVNEIVGRAEEFSGVILKLLGKFV